MTGFPCVRGLVRGSESRSEITREGGVNRDSSGKRLVNNGFCGLVAVVATSIIVILSASRDGHIVVRSRVVLSLANRG